MVDDFENLDGRARFESSLKQIATYSQHTVEQLVNKLLAIGAVLNDVNKENLSMSLLSYFPDDQAILDNIQQALGDKHTKNIILARLTSRLIKVNEEICQTYQY